MHKTIRLSLLSLLIPLFAAAQNNRTFKIYINKGYQKISIPVELIDSVRVTSTTNEISNSSLCNNGLPIIKLTADGPIEKEQKTNGTLTEVSTLDGITNESLNYMTIAGRGYSTWLAGEKKPYKVKLQTRYSIAGLPAERSYIFLSNPFDNSMLRNEVGFALSRISNLEWTPNSAYADVYLNDDYRGTYQITDKVGISETKLNIGNNGYLLEVTPSNRITNDELYIKTKCGLILTIYDFEGDAADDAKYKYLSDYVNYCEEAIYAPNGIASNGMSIDDLIDIDSYVDWYLINEITKNVDASMFASCNMHITLSSKLYMGPVWDFDLSLGNCFEEHAENLRHPEGLYIAEAVWFKQLLAKDFFFKRVKQRFRHFYTNRYNLINTIKRKAELIRSSALCNAERWNNGVNFDEEVTKLVNFLDVRFEWLNNYYFPQ